MVFCSHRRGVDQKSDAAQLAPAYHRAPEIILAAVIMSATAAMNSTASRFDMSHMRKPTRIENCPVVPV